MTPQRTVSILGKYSRNGASSRLRTIQYIGYLQAEDINVAFNPLFSASYLHRLYSGKSTLTLALAAYVKRAVQLRRACHADVLWVEKEALPWFPWGIERALLPRGVPLIVDYDDAVFHRYDQHRSAFVRRLLGRKLDRLMATASLVTAGNNYLADRALAAGAKRVEIVPTVVDMNSYMPRPVSAFGLPLMIGWIGTPSTWIEYMAPMMPLLVRTAKAAEARIVAVGAGHAAEAHPLLDNQLWTEESEVQQIRGMDIGIMPLTDTPWSRGKCGYKLIQYMASGIPVVASPVGINREIVEHGVNGFLASNETEWQAALMTLLDNPDLRARMGKEGRRKVQRDYSLQAWGPRVANLLIEVAQSGKS